MRIERLFLGLLLGMSGAIVCLPAPVAAQLRPIEDTAPDRSLGTTVVPLNAQVDLIRNGTRSVNGANLFHSFQEFNIDQGRGVFFIVPDANVVNILARVTGSNPSQILGTLGSRQEFVNGAFPNTSANLFLMNPNGIVFGENARLDVGGSFAATTANAIGFGDRGNFSATNPTDVGLLLTINPSAYLFNRIPSGTIVNRSVANNGVGLRVLNGQSLTMLGGDVAMEGGQLNAWGGRVELGAVAEPGQVAMLPSGALGFAAELARGRVTLTDGAQVDVQMNGGGAIYITAKDIRLANSSQLLAGIDNATGTATSRAGDVNLDATGAIQVVDSSRIHNNVSSDAIGTAGNIQIAADVLQVTDGSQLGDSFK